MNPKSVAPQLLRAGDRAWIVDVDPDRIAATAATARDQAWFTMVEDMVPAGASILFRAHDPAAMDRLGDSIRALVLAPAVMDSARAPCGESVVVPVRYDGRDLDDVAAALGLTVEQVIAAHCGARHRVGFFGFAPGFAYIEGLPDQLQLPRRDSPRQRVPAGAVAIAGRQSVIYPGGTPGGWHLIGSTTEVMWDPAANPPSRLAVGDVVKFEALT
ncbi:5-oxoprolinase subunit B family protein [Mycobacterium sp. NPDC003449]